LNLLFPSTQQAQPEVWVKSIAFWYPHQRALTLMIIFIHIHQTLRRIIIGWSQIFYVLP